MNRFVAIVALLSFAAFGDAPGSVTKTRLGSLHPREGLVVTDIDLSSIGGGITTNDVCNIVTNEVIEYTEWTHGNVWESDDYDGPHGSLTNFGVAYIDGEWKMKISGSYSYEGAPKVEFNYEFVPCDNNDPDALEVAFTWDGVYLPAARTKVAYNSLGLARLADLPPLTNGLARTSDIPSTAADVGALPADGTAKEAFFALEASSAKEADFTYKARDAEIANYALMAGGVSWYDIGNRPTWIGTEKPSYTAIEVGATTPEDVTAAIREQSLGGIWDAELKVWWTPRMRNGSLTYEATTNVNLNAEN